MRPGVAIAALLLFGGVVGLFVAVLRWIDDERAAIVAAHDAHADDERAGASGRAGVGRGGSGRGAWGGGGGSGAGAWEEDERDPLAGLAVPGLDPEVLEPWRDPQMHAHHRSFRGGDAGVPLPFMPLEHSGHATSVRGLDLPPGATCDVRVLPVEAGSFNCVMRVTCGGQVVYPDPRERAGYVSCELEDGFPVRALDDGPTMRDGDPTVSFDARTGRVVVTESDASGERYAVEIDLGRTPRYLL